MVALRMHFGIKHTI